MVECLIRPLRGWIFTCWRKALRVCRNVIWFGLYVNMILHWTTMRKLRDYVEAEICSKGRVYKVTAHLMPRQGWSSQQKNKIHWDGPLGITVWSPEGDPLLGLALEFWGNTLFIREMIGVQGIKPPKDLRNVWPHLFVAACKRFVEEKGLRALTITRARPIFYHDVVPPTEEELRRRDAEFARKVLRYDGTAKQNGFVLTTTGRWHRWIPNQNDL